MQVHVFGARCIGIEALRVTVEIEITHGVGIHLVGLADAAVKESLLRTTTALQALQFRIPGKKIVINLAPADLHKSGSGYDLPIAVGIIAASEQKALPLVGRYLLMGELGLDGSVRPVPGALPIAERARNDGFEGVILPRTSAAEARVFAEELNIFGVSRLSDVLRILGGEEDCSDLLVQHQAPPGEDPPAGSGVMDFSEIVGQDAAKRGIEIAVSGNHNIMMVGPPGSGKSSLARAITGILPPMDAEEALITSKIYSIAGKGIPGGTAFRRPFRAPHYSISLPALLGGGSGDNIQPGEVSLSHGGVLFLDEFVQMPKMAMEALRGPLEDRKVVISRLRSKLEYPASFLLVAAANPCPCGYYGDGDRCSCTPAQRRNYLARLSGPILDRIDLQLLVRSLPAAELVDASRSGKGRESSAEVAARVAAAREIQRRRFAGTGIYTNAEMSSRQMQRYCPLSSACKDTLSRITERLGLSARAFTRVIKLARTIADLAGAAEIEPAHLVEAAAYRFLDRSDLYDL